MTSGWRPRFGGRGRERAWWLLAAAVLFAVLWAVAQALKWPGWALAVLGGLAAAAALVMPELRARFKQDDTRAALVEQAVAVPGGPARLPLVREAGLAQLRVHAAQVQVPYVERDVQHAVAKALGPGRAVLLVGHSMAGKTRLAAQVVHQRFPDAPLLVPESGKALRELVGEGLDPAGVVVWLDDLERFLGEDGLTFGLLARLTRDKAILVATIRSEAREGYRPRKDLRPPEWEVLEAFTQIDLKRRHTDTELKRIRAAVTDPAVLDAVQHYGLAEYLGAGPEALDKFTKGETTQPIGHALVRAAVDWRRTGLTRPIPNTVLTAPALVSVYLADRPDVPRTEAALDQGMDWATTKINETVALLGIVFPDPAGAPTFEAFDYLVDHLTLAGASIPDAMWQLALQEARPTEWKDLGYAAYRSSNLPVAELAIRRMAEGGEGGDTWVMYTLGLILRERGELAEAEGWYRRAADAGQREAMLNLGLLLHERGELAEVETWWRRAADAGESRAMFNLGLLLKQRGSSLRRRPGTGGRPTPATAERCSTWGSCLLSGGSSTRQKSGTGGRPIPGTAERCSTWEGYSTSGGSSLRRRPGGGGRSTPATSGRCTTWACYSTSGGSSLRWGLGGGGRCSTWGCLSSGGSSLRRRPGTGGRPTPGRGRRCSTWVCCLSSGGNSLRQKSGTGGWPIPATAERCSIWACYSTTGGSSPRRKPGTGGRPIPATAERCST